MEQIQITIDPDAQVTIAVKGHPGAGCTALTEPIEQALGETTKDTKTHEYRHRARERVRCDHRT